MSNDQTVPKSRFRSAGTPRAWFNIVAADVRRRRVGRLSAGNPPPYPPPSDYGAASVGGYALRASDKHRPLGIGAWSFVGHWPVRHWSLSYAFTLIELILVMALLSIVLAGSAPPPSGLFRVRTRATADRRLA